MLFYSPIAWLILIILTFQVGINFCNRVGYLAEQQVINNRLWDVTEQIFTISWGGIFSTIQQYLYFYVPLLTMGIMSRERSSGSIKLLFSSPVTNQQIVLGKYMALLIYAFVLMLVLSIYLIFGMIFVKDMDISYTLSALLGLYLLTCAYAAIGLFMSCLTSYQVVAAITTLALFTILNLVGRVGQDIPIVRDITYWLSIRGRSNELIRGLICSEDVLYFIIVAALFLCLSVLRLQGERKRIKWSIRTGRYVGVILSAIILGYISSQPRLMSFYDATITKQQTLTPNSQDVMNEMDGGLTITTYVNLLEDNYVFGLPANVNEDKRRFRQYLRFKPEIKMKYVYYYDKAKNESLDQRFPTLSDKERAIELADGLKLNFKRFLSPDEIRKKIDLSGEGNRFVRLLERENGQKTFLRVYNDNSRQPAESEISAAMKRLVSPPVNIAFLTNHGERDIDRKGDRDYYVFSQDITYRKSLINNGFDVRKIVLDEKDDLLQDIDILVITNIRTALNERELDIIHRYMDNGGNLIVAAEPTCQEYMNPIVSPLGVSYLPGRLVQGDTDYAQNLIFGMITEEATKLSSKFRWMARWNYRVNMPDAVGVTCDTTKGFSIIPLVSSDTVGSWNEIETVDFAEERAIMNTSVGEQMASHPIALRLSRPVGDKEQRILILGDADCFSNSELSMHRRGINSDNLIFLTEVFMWLTYGDFPINTDRPRSPDDAMYVGVDDMVWVRIGFIGALPLLFVMAYMIILIRRKRI
jgi:ABC-2 type transport system permease protein